MLFDHADHEPQKISRRQAYLTERNRELVSLATEQTDGSTTRDREVFRRKNLRCWRPNPVFLLAVRDTDIFPHNFIYTDYGVLFDGAYGFGLTPYAVTARAIVIDRS